MVGEEKTIKTGHLETQRFLDLERLREVVEVALGLGGCRGLLGGGLGGGLLGNHLARGTARAGGGGHNTHERNFEGGCCERVRRLNAMDEKKAHKKRGAVFSGRAQTDPLTPTAK